MVLWAATIAAAFGAGTREDAQRPPTDMSHLSGRQLAAEISSKYLWRRQTARRLLVERGEKSVRSQLSELAKESADPAIVMHALSTLKALDVLRPEDVIIALSHSDPGVRVTALRLAEPWLDRDDRVWQAVSRCSAVEPQVRLQLALSLGESHRGVTANFTAIGSGTWRWNVDDPGNPKRLARTSRADA